MSKASAQYTASDLLDRLRHKYGDRQRYAFLTEVGNATGMYCRSWVDAVVVNLWPSDGLYRHGFEIKVSRGDLVKELQTPSKNEWVRAHCHSFTFVAPKSIVKDASELPKGAGWLYPRGDNLVTGRVAELRQDAVLDELLLAAFIRSAVKSIDDDRQAITNKLIREDSRIQDAFACRDVLDKFFKEHGKMRFGGADAIRETLMDCTADERIKLDRRAIQDRLEQMQESMLDLYMLFGAFAHIGLLELDETGKFVLDRWGGKDSFDVAAKRERSSYKGSGYHKYAKALQHLLKKNKDHT